MVLKYKGVKQQENNHEDERGDIEARVVADSISPEGVRLISIEGTMARYVLAELNTHRMFSRNSASSRAIPVHKQLARVLKSPYIPFEWGQNMPGMQAKELLPPEEAAKAERIWRHYIGHSVISVVNMTGGLKNIEDPELRRAIKREKLLRGRWLSRPLRHAKVHKQVANRLLEAGMHHTVLITATEWTNFLALRISENAQPDIRKFAQRVRDAIEDSTPKEIGYEEMHMPYVSIEGGYYDNYDPTTLKKVATAKAARLSYLNQEQEQRDLAAGKSMDDIVQKDVKLHDRLVGSGHMSTTEHTATPFSAADWELIRKFQAELPSEEHYLWKQLEFDANFRGWHQYRKSLPHESDYSHYSQDELFDAEEINKLFDAEEIRRSMGKIALDLSSASK